MGVLFESDRRFQLWRAVVGHSQLLLRSNTSEMETTRVDFLFKPVRAMKVLAIFEGVRVREARPPEQAEVVKDIGSALSNGEKIFVLESGSFVGYVVASVMKVAEDQGTYADPSHLLVE